MGGEHLGQTGELRSVTDDRAGRVRLDQTDVGRGDPGSGVGPLHRQHLAGLARSGHAQRPPVARSGHRLDHGIDAVAVAFGVGEPFEHDDSHPLPQADAVGGRVETAGPAGRGQRLDGGEQQEVVDAVMGVHTATEHEVGGAGHQLFARGVERGQRGCAGRVHRVVHPAKIKTVGDPAGDDVGEQAGEGVLVQGGQVFVERGRDRADKGRVGGPEAVRGGEVGAGPGAEHDRCARPVKRTVVVPGVAQRAGSHREGQQLPGVDAAQRLRRNTETQRVERHRGQKPTPLGRHPPPRVARARVRVVVEVRVPAAAGHLGDRVQAADDVGPVLVHVGGAREHAGHADDGHIQRAGGLADLIPPAGHAMRPATAGMRIDAELGGPGGQRMGRALGDLGVQDAHRGSRRPQCRHLTNHEHALMTLGLGVDGDQPVAYPTRPLACNPQPTEVETLQFLPYLCAGQSPLEQFGLAFGKGMHKIRWRAPGRVPRRGRQQHGPLAVQRGLLEPGQNRP